MKFAFAFLFILFVSLSAMIVIVHVNDYIKFTSEGFHVQNKYTDYADYSDYRDKKATLDERSLAEQSSILERGMSDNYKSITDPISDVYLPDMPDINQVNDGNEYAQQKTNEYNIINIYKSVLQRQPTPEELNKTLMEFQKGLDEETLKTRIYNSTEYKMFIKMQSNDVEPSLVSTISTIKLVDKLKQIYKKELDRDAVKEILLPLKDCYIHLQYNDYLFRALLIHRNYNRFEKEVLEEHLLSREKLLYIFNKYFLLTELKTISSNMIRADKMNKGAVPEAIHSEVGAEIGKSSILGAGEDIDRIVKDGNQVFNINIILDENMLAQKGGVSRPYSNSDGNNAIETSNDVNQMNKKNETVRIYDPIKYKQHYRGDMRYRPNVCSYGTKQIVQPVFLESKTLFQGTDLEEAKENTQVGSIMPKFEYREYEDVQKS